MLDYIYEISPVFDHLLKSIKKIALKMNIPIIKEDTLLYLINLLYIHSPKKVLELGSGLGYSTYTFSKYTPQDAKITSVDLSIETINRCKDVLAVSKYINKISWVHSDALDYLKNNTLDYDLYFIDALKSDYPAYFNTILEKADENYIIIFDNLYMNGKVKEKNNPNDKRGEIIDNFNRKMFIKYSRNFVFLPIGDGLGIFTNFNRCEFIGIKD